MKKVAYVAGSYRSKTIRGTVLNIRAAESVALKCWGMGYAVICPHMNSALFDGAHPDEVWLSGDLVIISRLIPGQDIMVVCEGWESSDGTKKEIGYAVELGIKVVYDSSKET